MVQAALLAFLENGERPLPYAYICVQTALKNYAWVHVRGLNGGCIVIRQVHLGRKRKPA